MEREGTVLSAKEHDELLEHKKLSLEKDRLLEEAKAAILILESIVNELSGKNLELSNQLIIFHNFNNVVDRLIRENSTLRIKHVDSKPRVHELVCKINNAQKPVKMTLDE
jgi:hypothetical protein